MRNFTSFFDSLFSFSLFLWCAFLVFLFIHQLLFGLWNINLFDCMANFSFQFLLLETSDIKLDFMESKLWSAV